MKRRRGDIRYMSVPFPMPIIHIIINSVKGREE